MRTLALLLLAGSVSLPLPAEADFSAGTLRSFSFGIGMLRLGGDEPVPLRGDLLLHGNAATRLIVDEGSGATFGYRIEALSLTPGTLVLDILPLQESDERALRRLRTCEGCPAPRLAAASIRYPPRRLVREGDTLVVDLLERPATGERIVDVVKFSIDSVTAAALHDVRVRVRDAARHVRKGDELAARAAFEEAIAEYTKAAGLQRDPATHRRLARCQHRLGRLDAALREYRNALRLHDADAEARRDLAALYLDRGAVADAAREYRRAYRSDPAILEAPGAQARDAGLQLFVIAKAYAVEGRQDAALAALERARQAGFADLEALKADPDFAPLRRHPRFVGLLARNARS